MPLAQGQQEKGYGIMNRFFGGMGGTTQQPVADMTVTGEGCQPLSDLSWKKRENKFLGEKSISTREQQADKDLEKKSETEKYLLSFPPDEKYLGFENDSNICYANSAIQVLYHCRTFREQVVNWKPCNT